MTKAERVDHLKTLYDKAYKEGDKILKELNPCHIREQDGELRCGAGDFCCHGCKHLTPEGCSVKALACKLWLCLWAETEGGRVLQGVPAAHRLNLIRKDALKKGVPMIFRGSKPECFRGYLGW